MQEAEKFHEAPPLLLVDDMKEEKWGIKYVLGSLAASLEVAVQYVVAGVPRCAAAVARGAIQRSWIRCRAMTSTPAPWWTACRMSRR